MPPAVKRCLQIAAVVLGCGCAALATAHEYTAGSVSVTHPWARATPPGATVGVAFAEVSVGDGAADTLVSASSPVAGRVEVHSMTEEDGIMKMRRLDTLAIAPGKPVVLSPAGNHIMLFDLKQPLKDGDLIQVTLVFEKAGPITIDASVEPMGANGPHGLVHQPGQEPESGEHTGHEHQ